MAEKVGPSAFYRDRLNYNPWGLFQGAKVKIKWADRHLVDLANAAHSLPPDRHQNFLVSAKLDVGKVQITYMPQPMPLEFAALVGDAVHNIRTALDFSAIALTTRPLGTGKLRKTAFPSGRDLATFDSERKDKMKGASVDALRLVEELEPYDGGQYSIRELHDLDILDKHKLLIPTTSIMNIERLNASFRDAPITLRGRDFESVADGANFVATLDCLGIKSSGEFQLDDNLDATFSVVFGKGQPLEGQPIVPALTEISGVVKRFIDRCEEHFLT